MSKSKEVWKVLHNIVDRHLNTLDPDKASRFQTKSSAIQLSTAPVKDLDVSDLLNELLKQIKMNYTHQESSNSDQNWRWEKQLKISDTNTSQEKNLEKSLSRLIEGCVNQVPTASGVFDSGGGKRAIDLVLENKNGVFDFIELKVKSNTPLMAAIEVIEYGILYIFSRQNIASKDHNKKLYNANQINLRVLAPSAYYSEFNLKWLETVLNQGFQDFLKDESYSMSFYFNSYPNDFELPEVSQDISNYVANYSMNKFFAFEEKVLWNQSLS